MTPCKRAGSFRRPVSYKQSQVVRLERVKGIEPSSSAWKAVALPLSYTRLRQSFRRASPPDLGSRLAEPERPSGAKAGGRGRTRTYEGIASGFTVRPLCRSGHSPKTVAQR